MAIELKRVVSRFRYEETQGGHPTSRAARATGSALIQ
jgi:hypothetical protein